ncbi:MAG: nickel-dependent lactate racemase [Acidobacteria bacterium]|nr:nickel-dependent lactate racemase [Acidobacteriota bacterium]
MKVTLAYGKTGLELDVPASATVLEPRYAPDLADPQAALRQAIDAPIGCPPLRELARGKRSAAISVCDITRPAPNKLVLPHVLAALEEGGIPREGIRILIATGLHREATPAELDEIVGRDILEKYEVDSHRAKNLDEQAHLGETVGGTPVYIDKRFVEADLHLTLGFIEPHLMAGFSGGRKLISIGLAGERTIKRLHSPLFMRDRAATEGSFPDNPLHRELIEIAGMAGHDFMIDVALTHTRGIAAVFAGEPRAAHAQGVDFVRQSTLAAVDEPADLVVTTSGGYPLDLTFYQAVKGVTAASHVVKPGGTILLVAKCSEGMGGPEFAELVRRSKDWRSLLDELAGAPVTVDQWQIEKLALVAQHANLAFCLPGISAEDRACLWGPSFETPQEALDALRSQLPAGATTLIIPEGPYVFTQVQPEPALV